MLSDDLEAELSHDDPRCWEPLQSERGLHCVCSDTRAFAEAACEDALRSDVSRLGSTAEPVHGLGRIDRRHAHVSEETPTEVALRFRIARFGSSAEPGYGLLFINCNASAVEVHHAKDALGTAVVRLCSPAQPVSGLHIIRCNTSALEETHTEVALRERVPPVGSPQKPGRGLHCIGCNTGAVEVVHGEVVLRFGEAVVRSYGKPVQSRNCVSRDATAIVEASRDFELGSHVASASCCVIALESSDCQSLALELMDVPVFALARNPAVIDDATAGARLNLELHARNRARGRHEGRVDKYSIKTREAGEEPRS